MKQTTLREIINRLPCIDGLQKLCESLGYVQIFTLNPYGVVTLPKISSLLTREQLYAPLSVEYILKSNGIFDAVWALCVFENTADWFRFKADVAELLLPFCEKQNPNNTDCRELIQRTRDIADGKIGYIPLDEDDDDDDDDDDDEDYNPFYGDCCEEALIEVARNTAYGATFGGQYWSAFRLTELVVEALALYEINKSKVQIQVARNHALEKIKNILLKYI